MIDPVSISWPERVRRVECAVVIPTYNHAGTLAEVIAGVKRYCADIFVVNDGSTDMTAQLLATISLNGRVFSNKQTQQTLVTVLNAGGFRHRTTNNGITEYAVMEYTQEQRNENAVQPVVEKQEKMNIP